MFAKTNCLQSRACDVDTNFDGRRNTTIDKFTNIAIEEKSVLKVLYAIMLGIMLHLCLK